MIAKHVYKQPKWRRTFFFVEINNKYRYSWMKIVFIIFFINEWTLNESVFF